MRREGGSPRRRRRSLSALLPAALLVSVLLAAPVVGSPIARPEIYPARTAGIAAAPASAAVSRQDAAPARRPGWSVSREAVQILVLSYVGIGAVAAAGIWSYVRRGRW